MEDKTKSGKAFSPHLLIIFFPIVILTALKGQGASEAVHILEGEIGFGARALGMGGAFTAVANDHSALYWNPAGLAAVPQASVSAELSNYHYENKADYLGQITHTTENFMRGNANNYVIPLPTIRGSFVVGFGWNRILHYDESLAFSGLSHEDNGIAFPLIYSEGEKDFLFNKNVFREEEVGSRGGLSQFSMGAGIAMSPQVTAGFSLSRSSGKEVYTFGFNQRDSLNQYQVFPANFSEYWVDQSLQTTYQSWMVKLGIMAAPTRFTKIGLTLTLPSTFQVNENYTSNEYLSFDDGFDSDTSFSGFWDYRVSMPLYLDGGISLMVGGLTTAISIRFRDWSATRFDLEDFDENSEEFQDLSAENIILAHEFRGTVEFHGGAEYVFRFKRKYGLGVRGGYALYPSPKKTGGNDRALITGGIGLPIGNRIDLDVAILQSRYNRTSSDTYTPAGTTEFIKSTRLLFTINVRI